MLLLTMSWFSGLTVGSRRSNRALLQPYLESRSFYENCQKFFLRKSDVLNKVVGVTLLWSLLIYLPNRYLLDDMSWVRSVDD